MTREEQDLADRQRATHWNKILKHLNFLDGDDLNELKEEIDAILHARDD